MLSEGLSALEAEVMGYFRRPDWNRIVALFAAETVDQHWRPQTVLTLPVFLALMMDGVPASAAGLVEAIRSGDPVKVEVVAQALNYSHHPDRRRLMERLVGESAAASMDEAGAAFKLLVPSHPVHVDMLWAAFFATGDAEYLARIAELLAGWMPEAQLKPLLAVAGKDEAAAQKAMPAVLAEAALLSLAANVRDIEEVRDALVAHALKQDGIGSALAARIVAGVG